MSIAPPKTPRLSRHTSRRNDKQIPDFLNALAGQKYPKLPRPVTPWPHETGQQPSNKKTRQAKPSG